MWHRQHCKQLPKVVEAASVLWITKSLTSLSLKKYLSHLPVSINIPRQRICIYFFKSPMGVSQPLHHFQITQLMGTGARTLIVPDTNTTTFLICISIPYISVAEEANWVMEMLSLLSRLRYIEFGTCRLDFVNIPENFNTLLKAVIYHSLLRQFKLTLAMGPWRRKNTAAALSASGSTYLNMFSLQ